MSEYIVSALKYRPQNFSTVIGQEHITTTLKNAINNNHLAHSFLFCGPRGVGKTSSARILAKIINCENLTAETEPCDACPSCTSFNNQASYNIYELDAASNNSVDDIRSLIEGVRFAPQRGKYKVYIIDEVHMLSNQAFNAFLKTLEEPPSHAIFILATTEKHKIIPTILSRCQIFDFKRITNQDTITHLEEICAREQIEYDNEALQIIAQKSDGCMRDALSLMDKLVSFNQGKLSYHETLQNLNILDYDYYFKFTDSLVAGDTTQLLILLNEVLNKGFEESIVIEGLMEHFRNLLVSKNPDSVILMQIVESAKDKYLTYAQKLTIDFILSAMQILNDTDQLLKTSSNKRLHTELQLIKLACLGSVIDIQENQPATSIDQKFLLPSIRKIKPNIVSEVISNKTDIKPSLKIDNTLIASSPQSKSEPNPTYHKGDNHMTTTVREPSSPLGGFSLKKLKNQVNQAQEEAAKEIEKKMPQVVTQDILDSIWQDILEYYKKEKKIVILSDLEQLKLSPYDEHIILVTSPSPKFEAQFKDSTTFDYIANQMKSRLNHDVFKVRYAIEQQEIVNKEQRKSKLEILEDMKRKNPTLDILARKIGLEIDYNL